MGFKYLYLATLLLVGQPEAVRPNFNTPDDNDEDAKGVNTTTDTMKPERNQAEVQNHKNNNGKGRPPPINHHIWKILQDHPWLMQDLHRHPRCLEVLALAIETNSTENGHGAENENVTWTQERQERQLMDEIERHSQCSALLLGILVQSDPSGIRGLFNVHPEGLLLLQAFGLGLVTYFILSNVIRCWALHVASNVKDPLACLNDPAPAGPWALSWIFACCKPQSSGSSGQDPGSCDGPNLENAWKGLEKSQQTYLRSVMNKARSLQVAGIAEQRVSGMWKMIEMGAAALTPIFISVEGMFGDKFSQPLKVVAILLSLVTTVCQVAPKNQATAILDFHARLRKLVFAYWSLTGIFNVYEKNEDKRPSMKEKAFQTQRARVFSSFVMALSEEVQDAENELKDVITTTRLTKEEVFGNKAGQDSQRQAVSGSTTQAGKGNGEGNDTENDKEEDKDKADKAHRTKASADGQTGDQKEDEDEALSAPTVQDRASIAAPSNP